jgi:hypothetical protein
MKNIKTNIRICYRIKLINDCTCFNMSDLSIYSVIQQWIYNYCRISFNILGQWSVLLVEETGVPGENHRPVASHWQTLSHNVVSYPFRHEEGSNSNWSLTKDIKRYTTIIIYSLLYCDKSLPVYHRLNA